MQSLHADVMSYADAIEIVKGLQDLDGPNVNPACYTRLYTHERPTERALVLLHGFTNCPRQFDDLGREFFAQGWNVLIPRYPRHGYKDRLNTSIAELRADHLVAVANRAVDAGFGLGDQVTVAGLSLGAALAGYMAQTRVGIVRTVMIAPMFGLKPIPGPVLTAFSQLTYVLPNFYIWWNSSLKDAVGPAHGYPRLSTRAYAALFEVGRRLIGEARRSAPRSPAITVVTNAAEPRLDNRFTYRLIDIWRKHGTAIDTFEFPAEDGLPHDLIDPVSNPPRVTEKSYPVVERMISSPGRRPSESS
ncbi:MAG TPA: alpha/beta fold hydrolase [Candidatus Dormibacteraeota bacterium]|nr:alpha/beta fold hydrolase [Candidatus Dormibacteraeota bacterium]